VAIVNRPTAGTRFVFFQGADCCSFEEQELVAEICDGGNGMFVRISTQGWALDVEDLRKFINRLKWCVKQCEEAKDERVNKEK
jgi:hypothetical protein